MDADAREPGEEKEQVLREDRRLLGRLLGDVISEQVGAGTREQIETIRQTAVRFRRTESDPALAGAAAAVKAEAYGAARSLFRRPTLYLGRAVSHFSQLL